MRSEFADKTAAGVDETDGSAGDKPDRTGRLSDPYRRLVATAHDDVPSVDPAASLVVVTYRTDRDAFESVLDALEAQTDEAFELVVVDNGVEWDIESRLRGLDYGTAYVELVRNCGVTVARNLGAELARSKLLVFLDDDAVPAEEFVAAHRRAHDGDAVAVRGRVVPRSDAFYNRLQRWYDLGDRTFPYLLNTEGNTSVDREAYRSVSGFSEELGGRAGHEGIDLTYRLVRAGYDREQIRYCPDPVVYHDYATTLLGYLHKRIVGGRNRKRLAERRSDLFEFASTYSPPASATRERSTAERVLGLALAGAVRVGRRLTTLHDTVRDRFRTA